MQDDRAVEAARAPQRVVVRGASVDHDRLAELARRARGLGSKSRALLRRAARSRGSSRGRSRRRRPRVGWSSSGSELVDAGRPRLGRLVRVDAEDREDARRGASASSSAARQPSTVVPTVRIRVDARLRGARDRARRDRRARRGARACRSRSGAGSSTRGKSGGAGSIPSAASAVCARDAVEREVGRLAERVEDARRGLGQVRRDGDGDGDEPVGEVVEDRVELARLASSFASSQGALASTCWLSRRTACQISSSAPVMSKRSSRSTSAARRASASNAPGPGVLASGRRGSGRSSRSSARRGCRGRSRARARTARGTSRA